MPSLPGCISEGRDREEALNTTLLTPANPNQDLRIGLIDASITSGTGFQSLVLRITEANYGVSFSSQTYTFNSTNGGLAAAQTFFHDDIIDLGALPNTTNFVVNFDLTLTSSGGGDGFDGSLAFGEVGVPEPATWTGGVGAALLLVGSMWRMGRKQAA